MKAIGPAHSTGQGIVDLLETIVAVSNIHWPPVMHANHLNLHLEALLVANQCHDKLYGSFGLRALLMPSVALFRQTVQVALLGIGHYGPTLQASSKDSLTRR